MQVRALASCPVGSTSTQLACCLDSRCRHQSSSRAARCSACQQGVASALFQSPGEGCVRVKLWHRPHMHVQSPQFPLRRINFVPSQRQDAHAVSEADLRNLIPLNDPVEVSELLTGQAGRQAEACTLQAGGE